MKIQQKGSDRHRAAANYSLNAYEYLDLPTDVYRLDVDYPSVV